MITYQRCKEIFSDSEKFEKMDWGSNDIDYNRVNMKSLAKDGFHYDFGFRKMPNGFNDVAEVFFGKWTPMQSKVVFSQICDEDSLLKLIDICHNQGTI